MREYRIRHGNFKGSHSIYESVAEFKKDNPDVPIIRWAVDMDYKAVKTGCWIEAEDGYIVQCIKVATLESQNPHRIRTAIRFPMRNVICYDRVKKAARVPMFYAMYTNQNRSSFTDQPISFNRAKNDVHMIMWAELVLNGMHPFDAYRAVFNDKKFYTGAQMMNKIIGLIHNRHVRKAIMGFINNFSKKLKVKISEDDLVNMIDKHIKAVKPGTPAYVGAIRLVKEIYQDSDKMQYRVPSIPENGETAEEATYEEVDPPLLEQQDN